MQSCWLLSFTPITYLSKLIGINERLLSLAIGWSNSIAAYLHSEVAQVLAFGSLTASLSLIKFWVGPRNATQEIN